MIVGWVLYANYMKCETYHEDSKFFNITFLIHLIHMRSSNYDQHLVPTSSTSTGSPRIAAAEPKRQILAGGNCALKHFLPWRSSILGDFDALGRVRGSALPARGIIRRDAGAVGVGELSRLRGALLRVADFGTVVELQVDVGCVVEVSFAFLYGLRGDC